MFKPLFYCISMILTPLYGTERAYAIDSEYWGYCSDQKAFADAAFTLPKQEADWVCRTPTADQTGEAVERNTLRCLLDQKESCQIGFGGLAEALGEHNVPGAAWYWVPGTSLEFPDVRCECGCFTGDVQILSHRGPMSLAVLAQKANSLGGISVGIFSNHEDPYKASLRLSNRDFIVGPEAKPIVHITTRTVPRLTLTENHPVLVLRDENLEMVRAVDLEVGATLLTAEGTHDQITALSSYQLPAENRLVYNFDTKGKTDFEHIILANTLRVGDLYWQKRLSELDSRAENLLRFEQP